MLADKNKILAESVDLKDELNKMDNLDLLLNDTDKKEDYLNLGDFIENESCKTLSLMKA